MLTTADFQLTPERFAGLWSGLGFARTPYPLDTPGTGTNAHAWPKCRAELGRSADRLEVLLSVLGHRVRAVDVVAELAGSEVRALAASDNRLGVLAVVEDGMVRLTEIRPTALATSLVSVLPAAEAGPGHAFTLSLQSLHHAVALCDEGEVDEDAPWGGGAALTEREALVKAGLSTKDAALLSELTSARTAGGQFGIEHATGRAPVLVTWFDTGDGRYLVVRDRGWLSVTPTDNSRIASRIESALSAAR